METEGSANPELKEELEVKKGQVNEKGDGVTKEDAKAKSDDKEIPQLEEGDIGDFEVLKDDKISPEVAQLLAKGILETYEPPLATINTHLRELTEKQEEVHYMLTSERRKLEDTQNDAMLDAMLADIATNKEKLASIQNSMMNLHKRVQALQVRATNIEKAAKTKAANQNNTSANTT